MSMYGGDTSSEAPQEDYTMNIRINNVSKFREDYREYKLALSKKETVERNQTFETIQDIMNNTDLNMNNIEQWDECTIQPNGTVRGYLWASEAVDMSSSGV